MATGATAAAMVSGAATEWLRRESAEPGTVPGATPGVEESPDGYLAVAPRVLRAGQTESVSLALFKGERPASGTVVVSLLKDGQSLAETSGRIPGRGTVPLPISNLAVGDYTLKVAGQSFSDQIAVRVESGAILFVETDKPIYKPGQTIHIRVLALDPALGPAAGDATVEVMDAKGIKVFKKPVTVDDFGMASVDLPLSTEPNLGVWKIQASAGRQSAQVDARVERYVLPKYEVTVSLPKEWALASEPVAGTISAEYSFGKPVAGELEIVASRYVGTWQEYARVTKPIDGKLSFEVPAVKYATGSPAGGGLGSVRLDVTVREQATGYQEQTSQLVSIASSPTVLSLIPESGTFKPGLPFSLLVTAQTPDHMPLSADAQVRVTYADESYRSLGDETVQVAVRNGAATLKLTPPAKAVSLSAQATAPDAAPAGVALNAGYSPSGSFIHIEQATTGPLKVGDTARFTISATREATTFYYEVLARGTVVFSDLVRSRDISLSLIPLMAPEARLLVYQILPTAEVAADYLPFKVDGSLPQSVQVRPGQAEVRPGDGVEVQIQTEGPARVGLAAVDRSVFILAENRLNLQQVFDELERLFQQPQAELHDVGTPVGIVPLGPMGGPTTIPGAKETFQDAGVIVLTNRRVPEGKQLQPFAFRSAAGALPMAAASAADQEKAATPAASLAGSLAEVQRVRQFFPETWIWADVTTDNGGRASQRLTAPDSITTWMFRAVAVSKEKGLGIGEAELRVFQPFFVQVDLPYAVVRGEEFPVKVALYNYRSTPQQFLVELDAADWFDALDAGSRAVDVGASEVGAAAFTIRPTGLGVRSLKVTARSAEAADAIVKELIVEAEGVAREEVDNLTLTPGASRTVDLTVPAGAVAGSARAVVALTGSVLSQTVDGLDGLLQMPFGCGEQNMILFAPDVFIARYLDATGQAKPEVMAKAESLMLTGYQRELTYRRDDGSFSAFGQQDSEGSLWLTAFVLKTFAQARDLIFIDDSVLGSARDWIRTHQNADGSFDPIGFLHHEDLAGGLSGKTALTAFVAVALREAGDDAASAAAIRYLEGKLADLADPYAVALTAYALALGKSGRAAAAHDKLMALAHQSEDGLYWGDAQVPAPAPQPAVPAPLQPGNRSATIETTGYAALALLQQGDKVNAGPAARWLASRRNAFGGFGSTQDTVVALQALTSAATSNRAGTDATIALRAGDWNSEIRITLENADVLQMVDVPVGQALIIEARGKGEIVAQAVRRYNLPAVEQPTQPIFKLDVRYGAEHVDVNDLIDVTATVQYQPPLPVAAGMVVLDIAVPTGFASVAESIDALVGREPKLKRWDDAGRKVIFYIEDLSPNERIVLTFQARALYPVRAQAVTSQVYAYYRPEWKAESLGGALAIGSGGA